MKARRPKRSGWNVMKYSVELGIYALGFQPPVFFAPGISFAGSVREGVYSSDTRWKGASGEGESVGLSSGAKLIHTMSVRMSDCLKV